MEVSQEEVRQNPVSTGAPPSTPPPAPAPPASRVAPIPDASDPLLADLTEPQRQAVTHVEGPLLVLAGAGSGKTRVITRRISYLVLRVGLAPWNILAITFTNKAAGEMHQRVAGMLSERQAAAVTLSTFHSLCARTLRRYADRLELPAGYSIYDTADQTRAVKQALEALDISSTNFPPAKMLAAISTAKNDLADVDTYEAKARDFFARTVAKVYRGYQAVLDRNHALDFDDLLLKTVKLMQRHSDVLEALRERYQYVLIDEYQDTNHAQFTIAHALAAGHRNLCATGDPDQSIYSWRGADIGNILEFETHYTDAKVVRLEQNYRSTKCILAIADSLIRQNVRRRHKALWTENETGTPARVARCYDEQHEAQWVVEALQRLHDQDEIAWSGMAVFYRTNSLSRVMEDGLRNAAIPYQIARGTAFYDRKEIKDAVAYLRVIANPADEVNLLRIINTPTRGISDKTIKAMQAHAIAGQLTVSDVMGDPESVPGLHKRAVAAVAKFSRLMAQWCVAAAEETERPSVRRFLERILQESELEAYYRRDKNDPDAERIANLGELVSSAQQFDEEYDFEHSDDPASSPGPPGSPGSLARKLEAYLEQVSLVSDLDNVESDQGAVTLMTLHAAKGLEFPVIAMIAVEDGLLPHARSMDDSAALEEERRLCFVGITRARRHLMLSHARYRTVFGQTQAVIPSRFLGELGDEAIERIDVSEDGAQPAERRRSGSDDDAWDEEAEIYLPGTMVRHAQFGLGRVLKVDTVGAHTRARVQFAAFGTKTLVLEYARLEIVDGG